MQCGMVGRVVSTLRSTAPAMSADGTPRLAGINVQGPPTGAAAWHYSGNYWWTTGAYFATLPVEIGPDYYDPEKHLFRKPPAGRARLVHGPRGRGCATLNPALTLPERCLDPSSTPDCALTCMT